jgi:hypothetical protein
MNGNIVPAWYPQDVIEGVRLKKAILYRSGNGNGTIAQMAGRVWRQDAGRKANASGQRRFPRYFFNRAKPPPPYAH